MYVPGPNRKKKVLHPEEQGAASAGGECDDRLERAIGSGEVPLAIERRAFRALEELDEAHMLGSAQLSGNSDVREFYLGLSEAGRRKSFKEVKFYKRRKRWAF